MVIQLARLGDLIQTIPLLQRLKTDSGCEVTLVVDKRLEDAAQDSVPADIIIPLDFRRMADLSRGRDIHSMFHELAGFLAPLSKGKYDVLYNLNRSSLAELVISQVNAARVEGFIPRGKSGNFHHSPWMRLLFIQSHHRRSARIHLADIFRGLSGRSYPFSQPLWKTKDSGSDFAFRIVKSLRDVGVKHIVALHTGAGAEIRRWGAEKFAALISQLATDPSLGFILVGGSEEKSEDILKRLPLNCRVVDMTGRTDIDKLAGLLAACDLFIGVDSGPLHLAAAVGVRTLGLYFASANVHETGPLGNGHIVIQADPECAPCREDNPDCENIACREMITPELAASAAERILGGTNEGWKNQDTSSQANIFESLCDEYGQTYRFLNGRSGDPAGFYRSLWNGLLNEDMRSHFAPPAVDKIVLEEEIRSMSESPLLLPVANYYYMVGADEGEESAARQFEYALELLDRMGVEKMLIHK